METIDYPTRKELVAALLAARNRGILVEVVGHGRSLKFPDGIGATAEDEKPEDDSLLGVVTPEGEQPVEPVVEGEQQTEEPDRSTFTEEGFCSVCKEAALAEPDGTWVHAGPSTHGDAEGEFVPGEPPQVEEPAAEQEAEDEDIIGTPAATPGPRKRTRKGSS